MSIETAVVIGANGTALYWHKPEGRSSAYLPDSAALWAVLWANRDHVLGVAHSHPGSGTPSPSHEDVTTFSAVERGLGRRLAWWITSSDHWCLCTWIGPGLYDYSVIQLGITQPGYVPWLDELKKLSNY